MILRVLITILLLASLAWADVEGLNPVTVEAETEPVVETLSHGSPSGWNTGLLTDPNVQALWRFDIGSTYSDSKNSYDWTANNTPHVDQADFIQGDQALDLEVSENEVLTITGGTNDFNWATTGVLSFLTWFKPESIPGSQIIFSKDGDNKKCIVISHTPSGNVRIQTDSNDDNIYNVSVQHATPLVTGTWYHIAVVIDINRNYLIRIWDETAQAILGSDATGTIAGITNFDQDGNVFLGNWSGFGADGKFDETIMRDDAISVSNIDAIREGTY